MRKLFWIPLLLAIAAYALLPLPGQSAPIGRKIEAKRAQVERKKRTEGVLTTTITRYNTRIRGLQGQISSTQRRLTTVQTDLDGARTELLKVRDQLEGARDRLERARRELRQARAALADRLVELYKSDQPDALTVVLEADGFTDLLEGARDRLERARRELRQARAALADRLVELYKSDQPDALTVVLEADGFTDLLERTDFLERISDADRATVGRVRVLKARAERSEKLLASLEQRKQTAAAAILRRRDDIAQARDQLASAQGDLRGARNTRQGALNQVRSERKGAQEDLASLEREQAKIQAKLSGAPAGGPAGPIRRGSGRLIWPVNGPITGAFGEQRPGHIHAGIDIAAANGTPIRAADSGRVVLMAFTGGYGNYTCIAHTASMSTCYAHQSGFATSSGANVRQGQVIGYVGNTGHSFGAHLHFEVRINGAPVQPLGYL